ncbi:MAG TPA: hypothetical protein VKR31_08225 [Rhizomicrobium sp.]|nr:hypothetical protein [Rhizomicrobium sp.]
MRLLEQARELRELASWYRSWDNVGTADERRWRAGFANYLDRLAAEMEFAQMRDRTPGRALASTEKHAALR